MIMNQLMSDSFRKQILANVIYHKHVFENRIIVEFLKIRNPGKIFEWCENAWDDNDTWGYKFDHSRYMLWMNTNEQYIMFDLAWND